jgi:uncharacterized membrane protein
MFSKIKILGHPVHPMLVGYPVALYTATLVGFIVFAAAGGLFWLKLAIAANVAGVGMAALTALPGFLDWLLGIPRGTPAKRTGIIHALLNVTALTLFAVSLGVYVGDWSGPATTGAATGIILSALGVAATIGAGFYGWMLVQDHHVGVQLTPEQRRQDEAQEGLRRAS